MFSKTTPPQKRPFVLLEVLLAIAILSLVLTPLIGSPLLLFQKQRKQVSKLAQKRYAPILFYHILKELKTKHPKWDFPKLAESKTIKHPLPADCTFEIVGCTKSKLSPHYHLCYNKRDYDLQDLNLCILYCTICFEKECDFNQTRSTDEAFQIVIARPSPQPQESHKTSSNEAPKTHKN